MCYVNPKVDFAFKKLFGSEENKDLLKALVNSMLSPEEQLEEIILKNPYNLADFKGDKQSIVDIKAMDERGRWYDIEIQIGVQEYFAKRAMYYWAAMYGDQLKEKGRYGELNKTICISLLDYNYLPESEYHNVYRLLNIRTYQELDNICELHFVELNKFTKGLKEVKTAIERWVTFLNNATKYNRNNIPAELAADAMVKKAVEQLEIISFSDEEREIYRAREKFRLDFLAVIETAEHKAREKGVQEGLAEGRAKGREEGRAEGREEGRAQGRAEGRLEVARNLLANGLKAADVAKFTGISLEDIERL
ncbi:hypothetical protein SCACP_31830 [Sporomusa carbonis]|uniref:Rpn family recombination-promoting nuclease/putative transposase n=1 Tax=Sporomusa carbonis TaxID=3076075 RepID=UPI003A6B0E0B